MFKRSYDRQSLFESMSSESGLPPPQAVVLVILIVSLFQIPTHMLMQRGLLIESVLFNELIAVLAVPVFLSYAFHYDRKKLFPLDAPRLVVVVLALTATIGADVLIDYLTAMSEWVLPLPAEYRAAIDAMMTVRTPFEALLKLCLLCVLPGICEEFLFRGFCQGSLSVRWGKAVGLFIASVVFSMLHGNPWYFHLYVLLGLFFGAVYMFTGTLVVPILCHVLNNVWSIVCHNYSARPLQSGSFSTQDFFVVLAALAAFSASMIAVRRFSRAGDLANKAV